MLGDSVKRRQGTQPRRKPAKRKVGRRRWGWKLLVALLAALTLPFLAGYLIAVRALFPPPPIVAEGIPVPDIVGSDIETAQRTMIDAGLGRLNVSALPSLTAPEGRIIAQSPLPGQQLRAAAPVYVAVSSGSPRVLIPDVVGFPVERAASLLVRLGFQVQRYDSVSRADAGRVIGLNPQPGSQLRLPARVAIVVSTGMPDSIPADSLMRPDTGTALSGWSGRGAEPMFRESQVFTPTSEVRENGRQ